MSDSYLQDLGSYTPTTGDLFTSDLDVIQDDSPSSRSSMIPNTRKFRIYSTITVEILGIIFNMLTMIVFVKTPLRKTGLYLFALAIADTLALVAEMIRWFSSGTYMGLHWMDNSQFICKFTNHLRYGSRLWSAFLTVTICIERYLVVAHPLKVSGILTRKSAKVIISIEFICSVLLSLYSSILFELLPESDHAGCSITLNKSPYYSKCNWIISKAIGEVVTSILVLFFTILIISEIIKSRSFRQQTTDGKSSAEFQLTIMLTLVATAFFFLRAPYTVQYYLSHNRTKIFSGTPEYMSNIRYILRQYADISFFLYTSNHSINFFLYCFAGSKFRQYLKDAFACFACTKKTSNGELNSASSSTKKGKPPTEMVSLSSGGDKSNAEGNHNASFQMEPGQI